MTDRVQTTGKFTGLAVELPHVGQVCLAGLLAQTTETELYFTDCPGIVVKLFNLECSKSDEISYGPYLGFKLELANYEDIQKIRELAPFVPAYHGAHVDYERKYGCIAMEFLDGQDLKSWCDQEVETGREDEWVEEFRRAVYETLAIIRVFHDRGIILLDFKPENILHLRDGTIRFVDLGAMFTPRHRQDPNSFVYSATPDHAEVLIDASNLQTGLAPTEASDVFSAGVALFEMATGTSRLLIKSTTAKEILNSPELYRFRDTQIRDVWRAFPHLRPLLPLVQSQLVDGQLLFAEVWHVLKAYVGQKVSDWELLEPEQQDQVLLTTGTTFIMEQLPPRLTWLAASIAQATILRSARFKSVTELMRQLAHPVSDDIQADLQEHNCYLSCLRSMEISVDWVADLNTWEVRLDRQSGHWAIAARSASRPVSGSAQFIFVKQIHRDPDGHRCYHVVDELEADDAHGGKLTLSQVMASPFAWLGAAHCH